MERTAPLRGMDSGSGDRDEGEGRALGSIFPGYVAVDIVGVGSGLEACVEALGLAEDTFVAVARVDVDIVAQVDELIVDVVEKLLEVLGGLSIAGAAGEEGVAAEEVVAPNKGGCAGGVAGVVDGLEGDVAEGIAAAVFEVLVSLEGEFTFVVWVDDHGHAEGVLDGLGAVDVIEVGVSEEDGLDVGVLSLLEDTFGLGGGVDHDALVGLGADDEVGIVHVVAGDYLPDFDVFVFMQYGHGVPPGVVGVGGCDSGEA